MRYYSRLFPRGRVDADLAEQLKAEYSILQGHYESFDGRALTIKSLATPLLAGGLAVGLKDDQPLLSAAVALTAVSLWWLEGTWKTFQYCYGDRIMAIERYFAGEIDEKDIRPFQIYRSWYHSWQSTRLSGLTDRMKEPFVYLPYAPLILASLACLIWLWAVPDTP